MSKHMGDTCIICGAHPTVASHLFPQAIGRAIREDAPNFLIGSKDRDGKLITQNGVFDCFLCYDHEHWINSYEDYAIKFLNGFSFSSDELAAKRFHRPGVDTDALVKFACSILWRFHASSRPEAKGFSVGAWESKLREVTFKDDLSVAPQVVMFGFLCPFVASTDLSRPSESIGIRYVMPQVALDKLGIPALRC